MWGTDGMRVQTVDDGWCWVFSAVEHWNAECVGSHVCKHGTRFAALEPICEGVTQHFGTPDAGTARGLALRMDHGTQYTAEHFRKQIRYWGISASFALVSEPATNGVAERFNRTLKEQALNGRVFRNIEDLRSAVAAFVDLNDSEWRVEKLGFRSPIEAREAYNMRTAA
jgi:transposase InsO family protein